MKSEFAIHIWSSVYFLICFCLFVYLSLNLSCICSHQVCTVACWIHTLLTDSFSLKVLPSHANTSNKISPTRVRPDHLDSQGLWATREKRSEQSYMWLQKSFNGTFCLTELWLHVSSIQGDLGLPGPAGVDGEKVEIQSKWHTGGFNISDVYELLCSLCEGAKGWYGWKRSPRRERREGRDGAVWALRKSWSITATCLFEPRV